MPDIDPTPDDAIGQDELRRRFPSLLGPISAVPPVPLSAMPPRPANLGAPSLPGTASGAPPVNISPPLLPRTPAPTGPVSMGGAPPLSATPRVQAPIPTGGVTLPDPNDPRYRPLGGWRAALANLSQLSPEEGIRNIGLRTLGAPAERLKVDTEAVKGGLEAQKTQAQTELEQAEAEAKRAEIGKPKPVSEDKTVFTGPDNEKQTVQGYQIAGKTVYGVVGGGTPTANSPTSAQEALNAHLAAQGKPATGWIAGEPSPEERPAAAQEIEAIRGSIGSDPDLPKAEKDALLSQLRAGMTTKELDALSARFDSAAGRSSTAGVAEANRKADAQQREADRRADKAAADKEKQDAKDQEPIIAFDPKTKERIYTTRGEAKAAGLTMTGGKAVSEPDVAKEEAATRQFNDVQMNVSRYKNTYASLKGPLSSSDLNNMTAILSLTQQIERPGEGGFVGSLSAGYVPALANSAQRQSLGSAWSKLGPEATELVTGYLRAKGAIPAYQRALTGTGRTSQAAMEIEMANLPEPTVGYTKASSQLKAFQENIDVASKGLTKFPWLDSPQDIRKNIEGTAAGLPQGAVPGTMNGKHGYVLNGEFHAE